jgi:hypothetical protein
LALSGKIEQKYTGSGTLSPLRRIGASLAPQRVSPVLVIFNPIAAPISPAVIS